jgi:subtilisin
MNDGTTDCRYTSGRGAARLDVTDSVLTAVWVDPVPGHWSWSEREIEPDAKKIQVTLLPIADGHVDGLRHRYSQTGINEGRGVRVGVIDTGVRPHRSLALRHERTYPYGPDPEDERGVPRSPHGTHVAGIIASRADPSRRGVAPGVELRSYRIYQGDEASSAFSLALAIEDAIRDGCDIINLSLVLHNANLVIAERVQRALDAGVIVVAAAGNDNRGPLAFPASIDGVIAVGALGRRGTYPEDSASGDHACPPPGADFDDFIGDFSNRLREVDFIAPGIGTISTVGEDDWGVMDGTSQAAPVVTGLAARVLVESKMADRKRSAARARAVIAALHRQADSLGFSSELEGKGLILRPY